MIDVLDNDNVTKGHVVMISTNMVAITSDGLVTVIDFRYDPNAPYEVTISMAGGTIDWVFARTLLNDGLHLPSGLGDVRVWSAGGTYYLRLSSPNGEITLTLTRSQVSKFVGATIRAVPIGAEKVDVDSALARLLEECE